MIAVGYPATEDVDGEVTKVVGPVTASVEDAPVAGGGVSVSSGKQISSP